MVSQSDLFGYSASSYESLPPVNGASFAGPRLLCYALRQRRSMLFEV